VPAGGHHYPPGQAFCAAEIIRHRFVNAAETLRELYGRLVFNILCGNTDDHARNHGAFWDGQNLELTPAYDICPQTRTGQEASQSTLIAGQDQLSWVSSCLEAAAHFHLRREEALELVQHQLACIIEHWDSVCDEAGLSAVDRSYLWGRQFLNPFAFDDLSGDAAHLKVMADEARG
jgi:serine/threonine-protein kinase HipA